MDKLLKNDFEKRPEFIALRDELAALVKKANGDAEANLTATEKNRRETIWKLLVPPSGGSAN